MGNSLLFPIKVSCCLLFFYLFTPLAQRQKMCLRLQNEMTPLSSMLYSLYGVIPAIPETTSQSTSFRFRLRSILSYTQIKRRSISHTKEKTKLLVAERTVLRKILEPTNYLSPSVALTQLLIRNFSCS